MNRNGRGYFRGVVVFCTIAILTFPPGSSDVGGVNDDLESTLTTFTARPRQKPQYLDSRRTQPELIKPFREASAFPAKPMMPFSMNRGEKNPSVSRETTCARGEVKRVLYGRFDLAGTDSEAQSSRELQPVVECAGDSMTLTVRRTRAVQLRVRTGNDSSLALSKLPPQCGFSIHKGFREISLIAQYNGCLVRVQNSHYVLPLLWRRTPVRMSCPLSPKMSRALDGLSLCCSTSGLSISLQAPSVFKEPNVKVRGEWTPLLELVQNCGYSLKRANAEILITVPFLACGITTRGGNHTLFLQIGEVFMFSCPDSPTDESHQSNQVSQSITIKPKVSENLKPSQGSPPFYPAPPHFPPPSHDRRVVPGDPLITPPTSALPLKIPLQDEPGGYTQPPEEHHHIQTSRGKSSQVFPDLKDTSPVKRDPTSPEGSSPTMQPHNYVFNPYYHYYHLPKIPQIDGPMDLGSTVEAKYSKPLFYFNKRPFPHYFFLRRYDQAKTKLGESLKPVHSTPEVHKEHNIETDNLRMNPNILPDMNDQKAFAPVTPAVESTPSASQSSPTYMPLTHNYHQFHYGPQSENHPITASLPPAQQNENPLISPEDVQHGSGSDLQPEVPALLAPAREAVEGESSPHSKRSHMDRLWEEWLDWEAPVSDVVDPVLMSTPGENPRVDAHVQDHSTASVAPPFAAPSCPGTGSHFHCSLSLGCSALPVKDCILREYLLFSLPDVVVEPKVSGQYNAEVSCAIGRLTSNPHRFFVPLKGCGVTKQVIDALIVYRFELETFVSDDSLRMIVECSFYPGLLGAERLFILDPLPPQAKASVPVQIRIATDESLSFRPEAHLPLSRLRGRLVFLEFSLLRPPEPTVSLWVHYCLAFTFTPHTSAMLVYSGCPSAGDPESLPLVNPNTEYIVVTSFLSLTSPSLVMDDEDDDPEVYFFCLTEVCSSLGVCCVDCVNRPE